MSRHACLAVIAALALGLIGNPTASPAAEPKPEDQVRQVLLTRNAELRAALVKAWLAPPAAVDATKIRGLAGDVYASEARLMALGVSRPMMQEGASLSEVPYYVLAERARIVLDPWAPFAGRTFVVSRDAGK